MIAIGRRSLAALRRRPVTIDDGSIFFKSEWMETGDDSALSPTMFLVEQPAGSILRTHFHRADEFQLVVKGNGLLGRNAIKPLTVHYAGAYTGYGPITAGEEEIHYFTIRTVFDTGVLYIPEDRGQLRPGPRRQMHSTPREMKTAQMLADLTQVQTESLLPVQPDSLMAAVTSLPSGMSTRSTSNIDGAGQFFIVLSGRVSTPFGVLDQWESIFASPDEAEFGIASAHGGAEFLTLGFPRKT